MWLDRPTGRMYLDICWEPIRDEAGDVIGVASATVDLTPIKLAEEALERLQFVFSEAQRIAHVGSFEYVADTQSTVWSDEECRIYGLPAGCPSPSYQVMLERFLPPDDASLLHEAFTAAMQSGSMYELEHRIVRPDGTVRVVHDRAHPYFDEQGRLVRYVGATLDVTERRQAEAERERLHAAVAHQARLLDTIMARTDSRLAYLDRDLRYLRVNAAYAEAARMAPEEFVGRHRLEVFPNAPEVAAMYQRVLDTGEPGLIPEYTGVPLYRPEVGPRTVRVECRPHQERARGGGRRRHLSLGDHRAGAAERAVAGGGAGAGRAGADPHLRDRPPHQEQPGHRGRAAATATGDATMRPTSTPT